MPTALQQGSSVGVIGGGPAGSLCAYFLLRAARAEGLDLRVDVYEPRDFSQAGPLGCNMCGGIVSQSVVEALVRDGIDLPLEVVKRRIDSYVLNTHAGDVRIDAPMRDRRIAAIYRGGGPRGDGTVQYRGLDGHLLAQASAVGARVVPRRVIGAAWDGERPQVYTSDSVVTYDLVMVASGVKPGAWTLLRQFGLPSTPPVTTRAYITELFLGREGVLRALGSSMRIFLLDVPRLEFAAIIPKGEFATVCLLGRDIDRKMIDAFFGCEAVQRCLPRGWAPADGICHCAPRINVGEASRPYADRLVLVGDCGVTRLYKDGIGAAYVTAKAAAETAVRYGISAAEFRRYYWPTYRALARDNRFGRLLFFGARQIQMIRPLLRGLLRMVAWEQAGLVPPRMSLVLWDMFTGGAPYREIFVRAVDPRLLGRLLRECMMGAMSTKAETAAPSSRTLLPSARQIPAARRDQHPGSPPPPATRVR